MGSKRAKANTYKSKDGDTSRKHSVSSDGNSTSRTGDVYTKVDGGHTHQSYDHTFDKSGQSYKEYHGGENSRDRSYNK